MPWKNPTNLFQHGSQFTNGKIGASPHPTLPFPNSTRIATFSTFSNLDDAIVKAEIKGTFRALFSALCTSTVNVSVKFLKPKLVGVAAGVKAAIFIPKEGNLIVEIMDWGFLRKRGGGEARRVWWDSDCIVRYWRKGIGQKIDDWVVRKLLWCLSFSISLFLCVTM
ncbi:L-Ala-D/L-amino acid epimerase-like [Senna tora]|uniref:L-Ala-D/L-amino acid epimerase-like n=1 Tax=Senna tora TaxID=362788 RepID=A0A834TEW6_9FABA|nr:L-Ala-D/L-amino acid epimerase-like [Senna tora]